MKPIKALRQLCLVLTMSTVVACGGGGGSEDEPPAPVLSLSVDDVIAVEGDSGTAEVVFTLSLNSASASPVTVEYTSVPGTADVTDFMPTSGVATLQPGVTSAMVAVSVSGDTTIEEDEEFTLELSNPVNSGLGKSTGVGRIENDDYSLVSVIDASVTEGDSGTNTLSFGVVVDRPGIAEISVDYATSNVTAEAGLDYTATSSTLVLPPGEVAASIDIEVLTETTIETDEQMIVNLLGVSPNARIDVDEAIGFIVNDDFPKVSMGDGSVTESDSGQVALSLPITLDASATEALEVTFETSDDTAVAGTDYVGKAGTVSIPAGDMSAVVTVDTLGDSLLESTEQFKVTLVDLSGPALLDQAIGVGTIVDNDLAPTTLALAAINTSVVEGDSGTSTLVTSVMLTELASDDINFDYQTVDGTAIAGEDYVAAAGTATIAAGQLSTPIELTINGDTSEEPDESFVLQISSPSQPIDVVMSQGLVTITDDDSDPDDPPEVIALAIADAEVLEGDTGSVSMDFMVSLNAASDAPVSIDFVTAEASALEGIDYQAASGSVTFAAGETEKTISVSVIGDTFSEDDEAFRVNLNNVSGAVFDRSSAIGTILTDEPLVRLSISDASGLEGNDGQSDQVFTVSLDIATVEPVTFDYQTVDGTAVAGVDYTTVSGMLTIAAGDQSADISVAVNGDSDNEPDETYTLELSNFSTNAVIVDDLGVGSIINDDGTFGWQGADVLAVAMPEFELDVDSDGNAAVVYFGPTNFSTFLNPVTVALFSNGANTSTTELASVRRQQFLDPKVALLGGGDVVAGWFDVDRIDSASYSPGGPWTTKNIAMENGMFLNLDADHSGNALAVWENTNTPSDVIRNVYDAVSGNWSSAEEVEQELQRASDPRAVVDDAGNKMVIWRQEHVNPSQDGYYYNYYDAASGAWTGEAIIEPLASSNYLQLVMLETGKPALAVELPGEVVSPDLIDLLLYDPTTGVWASAGQFQSPSTPESMYQPAVAGDGSGNIFITWLQAAAPGFYDLYINRYDAVTQSWGVPELLENSAGAVNLFPALAASANGSAIVVWSQDVAPVGEFDFRIRASVYDATGEEWGTPELIDDESKVGFADEPQVGMDANGNAMVIWYYDDLDEIGINSYVAPQ